jgi:hydroxymethylglutaryl-CoA lyase
VRRVVLATSFGCPFEGEIPAATPLRVAEQLVDAGAREIVWADTIGVAVPHQVRMLLRSGREMGAKLGVHLHNTRNTGYANAYTALEEDVSILDAAIGGLGGCPFAPGATGNIATEDLVYLLEREGVRTGVDLDALISTAVWLRDRTGLTLDGQLHRVDRFPGS